ncbi:MAG: MDR/zinc-dependent alcohol dehydrogenase-like family protein [Phycisphaeraceae bacterium]
MTRAHEQQQTASHRAADGTMTAAVLEAPRRFELRPVPRPVPGNEQVRVWLEGCGVCASNVPPWEGRPWFGYPFAPGAPGHEGWGVIDAVGARVEGFEVGQRVALLSMHAYAEYDVAEADQLVPLPESLDGVALPGEPLGCAVNVLRRAEVEPGHTVAIVGVGFFGALLARLCVKAGARVIAIARRKASLEVARRQGAEHTIPMTDTQQVVAQVAELTGGWMCDRVIEATGQQEPLDLASLLLRIRGRLVIAGYHQDGPRQVNMQQWNWRGLDVINAHERDPSLYIDGLRKAIELVSDGALDPSPLFTTNLPLNRLNEAIRLTAERPDGFVKALVYSDDQAMRRAREQGRLP